MVLEDILVMMVHQDALVRMVDLEVLDSPVNPDRKVFKVHEV